MGQYSQSHSRLACARVNSWTLLSDSSLSRARKALATNFVLLSDGKGAAHIAARGSAVVLPSAMSWRAGLPHESALSFDVLTGAGEIVRAAPDGALHVVLYGADPHLTEISALIAANGEGGKTGI